jgi:hypothetical protein
VTFTIGYPVGNFSLALFVYQLSVDGIREARVRVGCLEEVEAKAEAGRLIKPKLSEWFCLLPTWGGWGMLVVSVNLLNDICIVQKNRYTLYTPHSNSLRPER